MSLWARIQYLNTEAKMRIYNKYEENGLSLDVRHYLAVWIENNIIINDHNNGVVCSPDDSNRMAMICSALIAEIKRVADAVGNNMDFSQIRLRSTAQLYQTLQPSVLYSRLRTCLIEEMRVLNEQTNLESGTESTKNHHKDEEERGKARQSAIFSQRICILTNNRKEWGSFLEAMQSVINELQLVKGRRNTIELRGQFVGTHQQNLKGFENIKSAVETELQKLDKEMEIRNQRIQQLEVTVIKFAQSVVTELTELVRKLLVDYIARLKWSELAPEEHGLSLDDIQRWYAELLEAITQLRCLRTAYLQQTAPGLVEQILEQLDSMFVALISNSLVVQEQPSQVIKKDTKFNTSVRFLLGERFINPECSPVVKVSAINEKYAGLLFQNQAPSKVTYNGHGKVINNVERKFTDSDSRWCQRVVMQFRNVAISSVRRGEKGENSCGNRAMTEKFCLLYSSKLEINGKSYEVWCCSVPFVFTVHVSQKCEGWGNIFWDNSFRELGRTPFTVPQEVSWASMAGALRKCFKSMTQTSWNLTDSNLKYIGEKIFRTPDFNHSFCISRKEFCEKETTSKICPWEWFYSIIELINKHLRPFWEKGYIVGFMDRCHAERDILAKLTPGTFMLRFSDSNLGGISISYVIIGSNGHPAVASLAPFTDSDLKVRSLSDRIDDAKQFSNVYYHNSDDQGRWISKTQAFPVHHDKKNLVPKIEPGVDAGGLPVKSKYVEARVIMVMFASPSLSHNNNNNVKVSQVSPIHDHPFSPKTLLAPMEPVYSMDDGEDNDLFRILHDLTEGIDMDQYEQQDENNSEFNFTQI